MNTPINVRGQRKRPAKDKTADHQQKRSKNTSVSSSKASPNASSSSKRQTHIVTWLKKHEKSAIEDSNNQTESRDATNKPLSALESLPAELIEKIFVYCLNVNLPRASPYLAAAVSNERVYRLLILLAYWDNDWFSFDRYSVRPLRDVIGGDIAGYEDLGTYPWRENRLYNIPWLLRPLGHGYVRLTAKERGTLQSDIIWLKWCTDDRIRRQLPDLTRLIITRWCVELGYMFEEEEQGRQLEEFLQSEGEAGTRRDFMTRRITKHPERKRKVNKNTIDDYSYCQITVRKGEFVVFSFARTLKLAIRAPDEALVFPLLSLRAIPPFLFSANVDSGRRGLVRGCFTDAHLGLLSNIYRLGVFTMHGTSTDDITYSRDALQQGVHVALSTINPRALDLLLKCDNRFCPKYRPYYNIPSYHFRNAARMYNNMNRKNKTDTESTDDASSGKTKDDVLLCFCLLLTSSAESVPYDDPLITQFAIDVGGDFGEWLLELMAGLPEHKANLEMDDESYLKNTIFRSRSRSPNPMTEMGLNYFIHVKRAGEVFNIPERWMSEDWTPVGAAFLP